MWLLTGFCFYLHSTQWCYISYWSHFTPLPGCLKSPEVFILILHHLGPFIDKTCELISFRSFDHFSFHIISSRDPSRVSVPLHPGKNSSRHRSCNRLMKNTKHVTDSYIYSSSYTNCISVVQSCCKTPVLTLLLSFYCSKKRKYQQDQESRGTLANINYILRRQADILSNVIWGEKTALKYHWALSIDTHKKKRIKIHKNILF